MKKITLYRGDFQIRDNGENCFDDLLLELEIPEKEYKKINQIDVEFIRLRAW